MPIVIGESILKGKYRILGLVGEGGMARVWLAEEVEFGSRLVAIKEPRRVGIWSQEAEEEKRRFSQEIEVGAMLDKARVPQVVRALTLERLDDGTRLLVMEYAAGGALTQKLLDNPNGMPIADVLRLASELCRALQSFHDLPLMPVHRDIKPSNILFDADGSAHLADFGVCQLTGRTIERESFQGGPHPGTPFYKAPEQEISPAPVAPPADLYALGCVLFEMLTRKFYKRCRLGTLASSLNPTVPRWLDEVLAKALAVDPFDRYQSADEMAEALKTGEVAAAQALIRQREEELRIARERQEAEDRARREAEERKRAEERVIREAEERQRAVELAKREAAAQRRAKAREAKERKRIEELAVQEAEAQKRQEQARLIIAERQKQEQVRLENERIAAEVKRQVAELLAAEELKRQQTLEAQPLPAKSPVAQKSSAPIATYKSPLILTLADGIIMPLVRVPAGEFSMGSSDADKEALSSEMPQHKVHLDEYLIGKYPVTVAQFRAFVQASEYKASSDALRTGKDDHPVNKVSWDDAAAFCKWASQVAGRTVRLPTEAEWEKAARGTDGRIYPWGNEPPDSNHCNFGGNVGVTTPVGKYSPIGDSPYGCVDMAGNVWEWVNDWYASDYYASSPGSNPPGPTSGQHRVLRGCGWSRLAVVLRSAPRYSDVPDNRNYHGVGFRCAVSPGI